MKWRRRAGCATIPESRRQRHGGEAPYYPEGGWGYVVVMAAFTALMVQMGLIVSMGIYLEHIKHEFQSGAALSGWISSGCFAVLAFVSPLASLVMRRFGCRVTAMSGGAIMCTGFVCGTFANSVVQLFIFADVVAGIGASMSHISATVVIGQYFNKRYALANGFAYTGQGIGIFIFPPILQELIHQYGWRGCLLVQGAISLHIVVAASLYRAVRQPARNGHKHRLKNTSNSNASQENQSMLGSHTHESLPQNENEKNGADSNSCSDVSGHAQFSDDSETETTAVSASEFASSKSSVATCSTVSPAHFGHIGECTDFFYEKRLDFLEDYNFSDGIGRDSTGSTFSLTFADMYPHVGHLEDCGNNFYEEKLSVLEHVQFADISGMGSPAVSASELASSKSSPPIGSTARLTQSGVHTYVGHLQECRHVQFPDKDELASSGTETEPRRSKRKGGLAAWRILRDNPSIYFVFAIFVFETFGYSGFFSHVVAKAREMGVPDSQASLALSIFGIGSLVGRATNGWIVYRGLLTAKAVNALALVIAGGAAALTSMVASKPGVLAGSFFSGLGSGWYLPLQQVLLRDIVGQSKLHLAYGYGMMFEGAASLAGSFVIGSIRDVTGDYTVSFYFLGVVYLLGVSIFALDYFCGKRGSCRSKNRTDRRRCALDTEKQLAIGGEYDKATPV